MSDKPTIRALNIFAVVAKNGPITLNQLERKLPDISRAALWRALNNLRSAGWLRDRMGDHAWIATHRADDILGNAKIFPRAVEELVAKLPKQTKGTDTHIGTFTNLGRFEIVESTDPEQIGKVLPLVRDPMTFAALAMLEEQEMFRHIRRWMERYADAEERAFIIAVGLMPALQQTSAHPALKFDAGMIRFHKAKDGSVAVAIIEKLNHVF